MFVCFSVLTKAALNTRSQTLNKDYNNNNNNDDNMTKIQPNRFFFCSAFQAPRWPPSARSTSVNVSHRRSLEMSLIWMYLLYFNTGSLNEMMTHR